MASQDRTTRTLALTPFWRLALIGYGVAVLAATLVFAAYVTTG